MRALSAPYKHVVLFGFIFLFISSCSNNEASFTAKDRSLVRDSVRLMAESIAKNVSGKGPVAWLDYFENSPDFFMASDGQLVFPDIDKATDFINNTLVRIIPKIELRWTNIRIDAISPGFAGISAIYHEDISDSTGKKMPEDGYFTGIAHQTPQGWKLHNAHWSTMATH